jgi:hypothetical protein
MKRFLQIGVLLIMAAMITGCVGGKNNGKDPRETYTLPAGVYRDFEDSLDGSSYQGTYAATLSINSDSAFVHSGSKSLKWIGTANWTTSLIKPGNGSSDFDLTAGDVYNGLVVWVYSPVAQGMAVQFTDVDGNKQQIWSDNVTANQWTKVTYAFPTSGVNMHHITDLQFCFYNTEICYLDDIGMVGDVNPTVVFQDFENPSQVGGSWGWGGTLYTENLETTIVHGGTHSIKFTLDGSSPGWSGFGLRPENNTSDWLINLNPTGQNTKISFWVYAVPSDSSITEGGLAITVTDHSKNQAQAWIDWTSPPQKWVANTWTKISIPFTVFQLQNNAPAIDWTNTGNIQFGFVMNGTNTFYF